MPKNLQRRQFKAGLIVPVSAVREGMFVSDLDSGWAGTPFMMQGLLLQSAEEINLIQQYAGQVTIDPMRSKPDSLKAFRDVDLFEQQSDLHFGPRRAMHRSGTHKYQQLIEQHDGGRATRWQRLALWWQQFRFGLARASGRGIGRRKPRALKTHRRPDYIPQEFALVAYGTPEPTHLALSSAVNACDATEQVLYQLTKDLLAHSTLDLLDLKTASTTLADNMILRPSTMLWAAKMRDKSDRMYNHGLGVAIYLTALGRQLGFQREQLADLANIGLLLDLGKIQLDQAILDKPAKLDEDEIEAMELHVQHGVDMLSEGGLNSQLVLRAIAEHHERIDGTGYPAGLAGDDIAIFSKMAAIADAYTAMINPRPYAPAYTPHDAMRFLFSEVETRWHGPLVEQFVQSIGIFPVGSLVELITGEVAIVVQHNTYRRLEPLVLILTDADKQELRVPRELDLMKYNFSHAPEVINIVAGLPDGAFGITMKDYYL